MIIIRGPININLTIDLVSKGLMEMNSNEELREKTISNCLGWIPARFVLYLMCLTGTAITFINRMIMNLAILAIVKETPLSSDFNTSEALCYPSVNKTSAAIDYGGTLDWSTDIQYYVLTSFYWTYILSQLFAGPISQKFGIRNVFGCSLLITSLCNLAIPLSANIHYALVILFQCVNGFFQGFTWTAIYSAIGHWIPIQERSRFVSCFQGVSLGTTVSNLLSGVIIARIGWVYVFYFSGLLGVLFTVLWYYLVHDTPELHPRISPKELCYIHQNRTQTVHSDMKIPWISILTSLPVWAISIASFGRMWIFVVYTVYGPLFLKTVVGVQVEMNGLVSGIISFSTFLSSIFFAFVSDKLVVHETVSLIVNRKVFSGVGHIIPGILAITIGHLNCNIPLIIAVWFFMHIFLAASFIGTMTNIVDISPSYTAAVTGFVQIILLLPTVLSTYVIKTLLQTENLLEAWRSIFYISGAIVVGTYVFNAVFASAEVQRWDRKQNTKHEDEQMVTEDLLMK